METPSVERESIRVDLVQMRSTFLGLLAALTDDDWHLPTPNPKWHVGHLLHHLVYTLELLPKEIALARKGRGMFNYPPALMDRLNDWSTRMGARGQSLASVRSRFDAAYDTMLRELDTVRNDEWHLGGPFWGEGFKNIEGLFLNQPRHYAEHMDDIGDGLAAAGRLEATHVARA